MQRFWWVDIEPETHGRIIFGDVDFQRYINEGEILEPASTKFHDWNDSYFVPGEFNHARRIDPIEADVAMSSLDGTSFVAIREGGTVRISGTNIELNGNISINGLVIATLNPTSGPFSFATTVPAPAPETPKQVRR